MCSNWSHTYTNSEGKFISLLTDLTLHTNSEGNFINLLSDFTCTPIQKEIFIGVLTDLTRTQVQKEIFKRCNNFLQGVTSPLATVSLNVNHEQNNENNYYPVATY